MEDKWDYLCSELGILDSEEKKDLIRRFVTQSNERAIKLYSDIYNKKIIEALSALKAEYLVFNK